MSSCTLRLPGRASRLRFCDLGVVACRFASSGPLRLAIVRLLEASTLSCRRAVAALTVRRGGHQVLVESATFPRVALRSVGQVVRKLSLRARSLVAPAMVCLRDGPHSGWSVVSREPSTRLGVAFVRRRLGVLASAGSAARPAAGVALCGFHERSMSARNRSLDGPCLGRGSFAEVLGGSA